jgi:sugar transferase (PEP-CTERM/EpsH1 system associated)
MHLVYSFGFGGMEVGVAKLANALDPATVAVSICSGKPSEQLKYRLRPEVGFFELGRRPGNDPGLIVRLARVLRRERPHILHTHGWATIVEGLLAARLASVPVLIHGEHGTLELRPFNRRVQRWAWGRATRVIAVSSRLAERMEQHIGFPAARIHVIRNGVDTVRFTPALRPEARAEFGFGPDDLVLGTAGRLVPVKDQATLLRAWALLRQRGVQFTGVIAGRGALKDELEGLAATLGLDNVRFLGNRPDVERVMAALDVFILSSVSEGLSNTIQEAMASGLPVVATHVGGADELVVPEETGLLVPASSPEAMADALARVVADPARRVQMGHASRHRAEEVFALDGMVRNYTQMYLDLDPRRAGVSARRVP